MIRVGGGFMLAQDGENCWFWFRVVDDHGWCVFSTQWLKCRFPPSDIWFETLVSMSLFCSALQSFQLGSVNQSQRLLWFTSRWLKRSSSLKWQFLNLAAGVLIHRWWSSHTEVNTFWHSYLRETWKLFNRSRWWIYHTGAMFSFVTEDWSNTAVILRWLWCLNVI